MHLRSSAAIFEATVNALAARYSPEQVDRVITTHRARLLRLIEQSQQEQRARRGSGAPRPWWQRTPGLPRADNSTLQHEARSILTAVRAYINDPEWGLLEEEDAAATIHEAILPHWPLDDAERLIQAVADLDGGLRDEGSFLEELTAALRDGHAPELEIHTIDPDTACEFVAQHHRHLPDCNRRGLLHALAARWRGQIAAVALAGAPTGRWGRATDCPPEGTLEITRVASRSGLRRYDRKGRDVPVNAASALVAHLIDLLPTSGRGAPGCRLITYQLTSEHGAIYRALVAKGLRPVALSRHTHAGGARTRVALPGDKIRWEAGPAAATPDWNLIQPSHRPGAQAAYAAFTAHRPPR